MELNGTALGDTSAWLSAPPANGSYAFTIRLPSNFSASPRTGVVNVTGAATSLNLYFSLVQFPAWFNVTGPGGPGTWSIRVGNLTRSSSSSGISVLATNGTYTYDVHPPSGFYAVPSHGTLTVAGTMPPVRIQFFPTSEKPSAALVAALSSGALWVSIWIGAAGVLGFAAVRGLRRRGG